MWEIWLSHVRLGNIQKQSWMKQSKTNCYQWISKQLLSLQPLKANSFSSLFQLKKEYKRPTSFFIFEATLLWATAGQNRQKNKEKLIKTLRLTFRELRLNFWQTCPRYSLTDVDSFVYVSEAISLIVIKMKMIVETM